MFIPGRLVVLLVRRLLDSVKLTLLALH
jgi:hypothetical protein